MTNYQISQQISIRNIGDGWQYTFEPDEYGTVCFRCEEGLEAMTGNVNEIYIPKDCIQNVINALEKLK